MTPLLILPEGPKPLPARRVIRKPVIVSASIEISTACNHRCVYCPVSKKPARQRFMEPDLLKHILALLKEHVAARRRLLQRVSFNHYNEPLLDPNLHQRIAATLDADVAEHILLNSNLSVLNEATIERLRRFRKKILWQVNIPSAIPERYAQLHGKDDFHKVRRNLERMIDLGFQCAINIQSSKLTNADDLESVRRELSHDSIEIEIVNSRSRAGAVPEIDSVYHSGRITGCVFNRPVEVLHIGVGGEVFLCCEDFEKSSVFTNVKHHLHMPTLMARIAQALQPVYGNGEAPPDHICRRCAYADVE